MDHPADSNDSYPVFYIGQHETKRAVPVTEDVIQYAQDLNVSFNIRIVEIANVMKV